MTRPADAAPGRAWARSYALERELGRGGMATVFLAHDLKHDRPVALKVLHPELAASLGPERFLREIRLAARLQHPHILTVLDSGEAGGRLWFTMPYVEGESLRDRLRRERQLPVDDALRIAREAAQALQYAHEHGVVHRDIKPENLLLTRDGNTLVADFGIARGLDAGGAAREAHRDGLGGRHAGLHEPGAGRGRPGARRAHRHLLAGRVLYEMLAGEPPFSGPTAQAMIVKRLTEPPPSVRGCRPNVPESVDQAIRRRWRRSRRTGLPPPRSSPRRCRPRRPARRPRPPSRSPTRRRGARGCPPPGAPAAAARRTRRFPAAAAALVVGLLIGARRPLRLAALGTVTAAARAGGSVLAVLPFENLGPSEDEYFADGVTDAVRGKLAATPERAGDRPRAARCRTRRPASRPSRSPASWARATC